jgi:hypothetical protein
VIETHEHAGDFKEPVTPGCNRRHTGSRRAPGTSSD